MTEMENNKETTNQTENKVQVDAALSEWEEDMVADLSEQYGLSDEIVLNIGVTFLMNELSASMNGKPSLLNSIQAAGFHNDVTLPDTVDESDVVEKTNE